MEQRQTNPNTERDKDKELVAEGFHWLELLDAHDFIGKPIQHFVGDRQLLAEEFPLIYGEKKYMERVHPFYLALVADPSNKELKLALRKMLDAHLKESSEESS